MSRVTVPRRATQRDRVLQMLRENPSGVTTAAFLAARIPRFGGRIHELRQDGWVIERRTIRDSQHVYKLMGRRGKVGATRPRRRSFKREELVDCLQQPTTSACYARLANLIDATSDDLRSAL